MKRRPGDVGLAPLLGWIGVLPCVAGLAAVTMLWRSPTQPLGDRRALGPGAGRLLRVAAERGVPSAARRLGDMNRATSLGAMEARGSRRRT